MLIKTPEFEARFLANVQNWITINRKAPLRLKGSYKVKEYGEPITDIDLNSFVYFSNNLPKILYNNIRKNNDNPNSPFFFIELGVGRYKGFQLPWVIDEEGGCQYNPQKVKEWFSDFSEKNLVPSSVIDYIQGKLFGEYITISNLIDVEKALIPYSEIKWFPEDIQRGYIDKNGERYHILDTFKQKTPVLKYVYRYNSQFVPIDVALIDNQYRVELPDAMYKYYTQNWYKILKSYRWKVKKEFRPDLYRTINEVDKLIALSYEIKFFFLIQKLPNFTYYHILKNNVINDLKQLGFSPLIENLEETNRQLNTQINDKLEKRVQEFIPILEPEYKNSIILQLERGEEAQNPVNQQQLNERYSVGIKCPFFPTDIEDYETLSKLAVRLNLPTDLVVNCFSKVATETKTPLENLVQSLGQNNYSLSILEDSVILREDILHIGVYPIDQLNTIRQLILIS